MRTNVSLWWHALVVPEAGARVVLQRDERFPGFVGFLTAAVLALYAVHGLGMGLFHGWFAGLVSSIKLPAVFFLTMLLCFPAFYVTGALHGPRLAPRQCWRLMLLATSANAVALGSYAPLNWFFTLTTSRDGYEFLVAMHLLVVALAGLASLVVAILILRATSAQLHQRARTSLIVVWAFFYGLVGSQLAWALRPWVGSWETPYVPIRPLAGGLLETILRDAAAWFAR